MGWMRGAVSGALLSLLVAATAGGASAAPLSRAESDDLVATLAAQGSVTATHRLTGRLSFVGSSAGKPIDDALPTATRASLAPTRSAMDYLNLLGPAFGLANPDADTRVVRAKSNGKVQHTRFQQTYRGLPVVGGEVLVNQDPESLLLSMSGRVAPELALDTLPRVTAEEARRVALAATSKWHGLRADRLQVVFDELAVFAPALIDGAGAGPTRLVWRLEVASTRLDPVREFVLIDAVTGAVALHFNQVHGARNRMTYDANSTDALPGTLVCNEAQSACGGIADAVNAHTYAADTYDYYMNRFNRDSIDGAGMTLQSTVRFCPDVANCPYGNAFWDGTQMVYGAGFASADDVVGHELTHGVTEWESGLFYYYQSGAINEALSDIFGEFMDQANGKGTDTPGVKWLMGEDLSIGAIRNMANPPAYNDPDRMLSPLYFKGNGDQGGVHYNSGIANKAAFLMADGGTFNGKTVVALGNNKTGAIWYEAQTHLLFSGADYLDLHNALYQACQNRIGVGGVVAADCDQVRNATLAVEMDQPPSGNFMPEALTCPANQITNTLFFENFEGGLGNWTKLGAATDLQNNEIWSATTGYARSEPYSLWGIDTGFGPYEGSLATANPLAVPAGAYLRMEHAFGFEFFSTTYYDGGVFEYTINNGTTWVQLAPDSGQGHVGTISNAWGNPLGGRTAFAGPSHGYVSSRFNLAALSGKSARFRFRVGADDAFGDLGWLIDNVRIYTCVPTQSVQFGAPTKIVAEGVGSASIAVTRTGSSVGTATVKYATANGTATAGSDFTATSGTLTFAAGVTTMNILVPIVDDGDVEGSETLTVTLSEPNGALLGATTTATVTITDNDVLPPQSLQFGSAAQSVGEGAGTATIAVTRTGGTTGTVTVNYATADGSATAGADYTTTTGQLSFGPGVATLNIVVPIADDAVVESSETFTVTLSGPVGAALGAQASTTVTITDNDVALPQTLQFGVATRNASEAAGTVTIPVTRSGGTTGTVTVNYATSDGTAIAGADYAATSGQLSFGPGVATLDITVPIVNDAFVESSETFTVTLSAPTVAVLGALTVHTVTILDDDTLMLSVQVLGSGGGSVASSNVDGIICGGDCNEPYARNTLVTLTAAPFPVSTFTGWGGACTGTGDCSVTMTQATQVTATFTFAGTVYAFDYVQKAYVAYYGRPADPRGQAYWGGQVDLAGGSINAIIDSFGNSAEFNTRYGGLGYSELVTKIYQQALNRDPDPAGLAYYVGELQAGRRTLQSITLDVLNGATTPPDSTIVANKLEVAAYYTGKVAQGCPYGTELDGVNAIAGVNETPASVTAAKAAIDTRCSVTRPLPGVAR